jgi:hypothetical protein
MLRLCARVKRNPIHFIRAPYPRPRGCDERNSRKRRVDGQEGLADDPTALAAKQAKNAFTVRHRRLF